MSDYILSCCSTADISKEHFLKRDLHYLCFHYRLDGVDYPDDLGESVPLDEFYKRLSQGSTSTTSQINVSEYLDYFESFLKQGLDVLHVTLSSGISGSYNSACNAANIAKSRYPERNIYVVDSLAASSGYGLLMDYAADKRDEGLSIEELRDWIEENKLRFHHWFYSTDLTFYAKGGRISKAAAIFGGVFNICPLLNVDVDGRLIPRERVRGKKNVMKRSLEKMIKYADNGTDYNGKCYMCESASYDEARELADMIEKTFPHLGGPVEINPIGTVIGSHTGPGTISIFFVGERRKD